MPGNGNGDGLEDHDRGIELLHQFLESAVREARSGDPLAVEMLSIVNGMVDHVLGVPESLAAAPAAVMIAVRIRARRLGAALGDAFGAARSVRRSDLGQDPERAL